jgi:uncharacterized protein YndB with AHSA1/START domain
MKNILHARAETDLVVSDVFNVRLEQIWRACSQAQYVKQWWGPVGFSCPVARMDFREGGTSLVCMRVPEEYGSGELYTTWTYERIVPMERIEFIQAFSDKHGHLLEPAELGLPEDTPERIRHLVTFKRLGSEQTELTVTAFGYTAGLMLEAARVRTEQCLYKLASSLRQETLHLDFNSLKGDTQ